MKTRYTSKRTAVVLLLLPFFAGLLCAATIARADAGPGWQTATAQPVSHEEAMRYLAERAKTLHITRIKPQVKAPAPSSEGGIQPKSATTITDPIADLAHGLNNDPKLIFDYVHNHIDYVPYYGSLKGATLTLLDGAGNDCDQAALLIALLRQAGYTAQFRYGSMDIPYTELANWLGVANNTDLILTVLPSGGIPVTGYTTTATVDRFWVQAVIDGTTYQFDPAWKAYTEQTGIDIGSAMNYDRSTLVSAATSAGPGATSIQNINETAITSKLNNYTANLVNAIRSQHPNATIEEIISGREIVQTKLTGYSTTLPFTTSNEQTFDEVPAGYTATIRIQHQGIDQQWIVPDIAGKRLTLTYNGSHRPVLKLDGTVIATGNVTNPGNKYDLTISIDHPYAGGAYDQQHTFHVESGASYAIVSGFGSTNDGVISMRQKKLDQALASGQANTSEPVLGESLNIMGLTWIKEVQLSDQLSDRLADTLTVSHHRIGIMAQEDRYYIDLPMAFSNIPIPRHGNNGIENPRFYTGGLTGSAFEHGIIEQLQDNESASTIKLLRKANAAHRIIDWSTDPNDSDCIQIKPRGGNQTIGTWSGQGYIVRCEHSDGSGSIGMIISSLSGGAGGTPGTVQSPTINHTTSTNVHSTPRPVNVTRVVQTSPTRTSAEPVDMASGAYLSDHTDLALGLNSTMPLGFHRSYTSAARLKKVDNHGFGYGWAHNYDIRLEEGSAGNPVLGLRTPVDAASMIAAQHVILDLLEHEDNLRGWMISSLTAKWAIDRVIDNVVTIHFGNKAMQFVKLPDGSFVSPPGITATLTKSGDTYTLSERFGSKMVFSKVSDKKYRISYQQDADGNRINFSYSSGDKLTTVANTFGHSLTLHYSGDYITSVSDSTNQSVSYGYTGTDLTSFTDPDSKVWQYGYDANHRITSLKNPLNTTTATNTYNGQGQVIHQTVPRQSGGDKTYNYYFSGYRNAEQDPAGNFLVYYFDKKGRSIGEENQLGFTTSRKYDGQDHVIQSTDYRGQTTLFEYDGHQDLTKVTDALGKETINTYDGGFHLIQTTDPLGHTADFAYDGEHHPVSTTIHPAPGQSIATTTAYYTNGKVSETTDGRGVPTYLSYDGYGNPKTTRINGQKEVRYQYDALGRLLSLTDQGNSQERSTTSFQYNDRGLVTQKTDPFSRITSYTYNDDGTIHSRTDRNGDTTTYTYTPTGKVDTVSYQDNSSVHFTYDQHDRLHTMVDSLGTTTYTRDAAGRVTSVTDANGNTVGYTYDENGYTGLLTTLTYPGGKQVTYTYDALNRLKTVHNWLNQTATYTYDDAGRLVSLTNFNGTVTTYTYDDADRLTGIDSRTSGNAVVAAYDYTLDNNGNRVSIDKNIPAAGTLPARNETATYSRNRLMSTDTALYDYDNEGQLASKQEGGTTTYSFDKAYRLTGIGGNTTFAYDGAGNRLRAVRSGVETRYIYDANGNLLAEADGSNTITRYYVHGAGLLAAITPANDLYCYHYDATGNTVAITDSSETVVNSYDYSPFGMIISESETFAQPFKYVGRLGVMAEANGFYYMRARYYDPVNGRFISEDPLGFDGGDVNLYVYGQNNPIMLVDPMGLKVGDWWDLPANFGRARQIAYEELAKYPTSHNDIGDARRHSEWMQRTTAETNTFTAWVAGTGHEIQGMLAGQPMNEMIMDLHNNAVGREAGRNGTSIDQSQLYTLPLSGQNYYDSLMPYQPTPAWGCAK